MTSKKQNSELQEAQERLRAMQLELGDLQVRIAKQKRRVALLTELSEMAEDSDPPIGLVDGITDACKTAVLGASRPLTPMEVRDAIATLGIPEQKNLLASVHTILKRLALAQEIKEDNGRYRGLNSIELARKILRLDTLNRAWGIDDKQEKPKTGNRYSRPPQRDKD